MPDILTRLAQRPVTTPPQPEPCPRCGGREFRHTGQIREHGARPAVAWRCVNCNWPRFVALADICPAACLTCGELNRVPRVAHSFTCWNCGEDMPLNGVDNDLTA